MMCNGLIKPSSVAVGPDMPVVQSTCSVTECYGCVPTIDVLLQALAAALSAKESLIISFPPPPTMFFPPMSM